MLPQWLQGLETDRLRLVPPGLDLVDAWQALHTDPQVTRYIYGPPLTPTDSWRDLAFCIGHAQLRGFSMWAIVHRDSGDFLGRVGPWMPEGWPGLEIGWALDPRFQGQGYATEAARAALTWTARYLPAAATAIHSLHPENTPSQSLAQRLGAQRLGDAMISEEAYQIWVSALDDWR